MLDGYLEFVGITGGTIDMVTIYAIDKNRCEVGNLLVNRLSGCIAALCGGQDFLYRIVARGSSGSGSVLSLIESFLMQTTTIPAHFRDEMTATH